MLQRKLTETFGIIRERGARRQPHRSKHRSLKNRHPKHLPPRAWPRPRAARGTARPPHTGSPPLRLGRCVRRAARRAGRPRLSEHAYREAGLGRRLDSRVAFLDHPRRRHLRLAARDRDGGRRPPPNTPGELTMVEPRRKHGSFDPRYPTLSTPATPTWVLRAEAGLDWTEFLTRFFPGRRRHDIEALAAYGAYRDGLERRAIDDREPVLGRGEAGETAGDPADGDERRDERRRRRPIRLGREALNLASGGTEARSHPDTQQEKGTGLKGAQKKPKKLQRKVAQKTLKERRIDRRAATASRSASIERGPDATGGRVRAPRRRRKGVKSDSITLPTPPGL